MQLKDAFPHLSLFSDMDWSSVAEEYEKTSRFVTFPEYLELKAEEGDCPHYLFELAYFDSALTGLQESEFIFPETPGLHLNPSARFLSLDHDILKMVSDAHEGTISVIERQNVLCIYVDGDGEIRFHELNASELEVLQAMENGSLNKNHEAIPLLTNLQVILAVD